MLSNELCHARNRLQPLRDWSSIPPRLLRWEFKSLRTLRGLRGSENPWESMALLVRHWVPTLPRGRKRRVTHHVSGSPHWALGTSGFWTLNFHCLERIFTCRLLFDSCFCEGTWVKPCLNCCKPWMDLTSRPEHCWRTWCLRLFSVFILRPLPGADPVLRKLGFCFAALFGGRAIVSEQVHSGKPPKE